MRQRARDVVHRPFLVLLATAIATLAAGSILAQDEVLRPTTTACYDCHDDVASDLEWTAHGGEAFLQVPGSAEDNHCEACHGDGEAHMEEADPELIDVPRDEEQHRLCLTCHAQQLHSPSLASSPHAGNEVYCTSCHDVHPESPADNPVERVLLRVEPGELCAECHADIMEVYHGHPMARSMAHVGDAEPLEDYTEATEFSPPPSPRADVRFQYKVERDADGAPASGPAVGGGGALDEGQLLGAALVVVQGDGAEPLRREPENFRAALRGDRTPLVTGADGRAALSVALAIRFIG